ncbi:MAG: SCO family protein [Deltaproteobacteria bacterium]|nr:SCO family protein [Deltaproteobacteria bacterium]
MIIKKILVLLCLVLGVSISSFAQDSLYTIPLQWRDETGTPARLSQYQGRPVIITMTYTTCQSACPLIMQKLRKIESEIAEPKNVEFVVVTFDPSVDTPKALLKHKKAYQVEDSYWHFLNGTEETTRKLSLLLDIGYQKNNETGHFVHDNKILLLDAEGKITVTLDGLDAQIEPILNVLGKRTLSFFEKVKRFILR